MSNSHADAPKTPQQVLDEALARGARQADPAEVAAADTSLDDLMNQVADPPVSVARTAPERATNNGLAGVSMRTARPLAIDGNYVSLAIRGVTGVVNGELAAGVSPEVVRLAVANGDHVVLECPADEAPLVVGVLRTNMPETLTLSAKKVHIEGDDEVLIRSGAGAMRLRKDGDVELVGSRIAAMSRGLFRLVGRVLRLN